MTTSFAQGKVEEDGLRHMKSCGFLLFKTQEDGSPKSFLLMKHPHRYDLPKGHMEPDETEEMTALRELNEETGVAASQVRIAENFRHVESYQARYKRFGGELVHKDVVYFLGFVDNSVKITPTEHKNFQWIAWSPSLSPPPQIQKKTVDGLLAAAYKWFQPQ